MDFTPFEAFSAVRDAQYDSVVLLPRSRLSLLLRFVAVLALLDALITVTVINLASSYNATPAGLIIVIFIVVILKVMGFMISVFRELRRWTALQYILIGDSLVVHHQGLEQQWTYSLAHLTDASVTRGFLGSLFDFGDVHLSMRQPDNRVVKITLCDVSHPSVQIQLLQHRQARLGVR